MALTYVFLIPPFANAVARSGKVYPANALGVITGVTGPDAIALNCPTGPIQLLMGTGTTAERPLSAPAPLTGAPNSLYPAPTIGMAYYDTTLSKPCWYAAAPTAAWVDQTGASI